MNLAFVSDPGVDDMVALSLVEKIVPRANKLLVSTFGNAPASDTTRNCRNFVNFVKNTWSFQKGARLPLNGTIEYPWPDYFHGPDGVWGIDPPKVKEGRTNLKPKLTDFETIVSLAPNTEVYKILAKQNVKKLIMMGGAFEEKGNQTPYAEFNFAFDSDAVRKIFEKPRNTSLYLVPLDVTRKVTWSLKKVQSIPESNEMNRWLKKLILAWFANYNHDKEKDFNLHDPLTVFLALRPETIKWTQSGVKVITEEKERGRTVLSKLNPPCNIALNIDNSKAIAEKIFDTLFTN